MSIALIEGSNIISIKGTNNGGTDSKSTIINYRKPQPQSPPTVDITNLSSPSYTSTASNFTLLADVQNVTNAGQIEVKVNGTTTSNFGFNVSSSELKLYMSLKEGANVVDVKATNAGGSASDQATITYRKEVVQPPSITFTSPTSLDLLSTTTIILVQAKVYRVDSKSQILVKRMGKL